jgi:hypothetical protein
MTKKTRLQRSFWTKKSARLVGIVFGLLALHFLAVKTMAQLEASRPGPYNPAINYGKNRQQGLTAEATCYSDYLARLSVYERAKRARIDEEWKECYRQAKNADQSGACSQKAKKEISDLAVDLKELRDESYSAYLHRKDLINKYWDKRK